MKRSVIASLLSIALLGAHAEAFTDNARVQSAEPVYENINVPRNECSSHWIHDRRADPGPQQQDRRYGGAIMGGLAGGVIGHQIGAGSGKDAATALGVVLGAVAGDRLENRGSAPRYDDNRQYDGEQREVNRCRTVYDTQARITGYRVAYDYRGQTYNTVTRNHPGNHLTVRVTVEPIER